jgi:hypothetical protein
MPVAEKLHCGEEPYGYSALASPLELPSVDQVLCVFVRLPIAATLVGFLGYERKQEHKRAELRTHMLVALGSTLLVVAPLEARRTTPELGRVIQGVIRRGREIAPHPSSLLQEGRFRFQLVRPGK